MAVPRPSESEAARLVAHPPSQLTSAHLHTGRGRYRGRDPFGGSAQIAICILPMQTFSHRMRHNSATQ
ncbi:hypothetical protein K503DRAFT_769582, partial [Rhizopogon vinicolor AM-OR11-026]